MHRFVVIRTCRALGVCVCLLYREGGPGLGLRPDKL